MKIFLLFLSPFFLLDIPLLPDGFQEGYYYADNGEKIEGFLKLKKSDYSSFKKKKTRILFKPTMESSPVSVSIEEMESFVIEEDSFATVKNIKVNHINGNFEEDFAKVIETGKINLYQHQSRVSDGLFLYDKEHYVLSKKCKEFLGIYNLNKQREEISLFFEDQPELMNRFLDKEFDSDLQQLIKLYNNP